MAAIFAMAPPPPFAVGSSLPKPPPPPPTFIGHPSYEELIDSYLRHRIVSGTKVSDFIHEADLYAADPDLLTSQYSPAATADDAERTWYFFTTLRPKAAAKKRKKRKADKRKKRTVNTGREREGRWANHGPVTVVFSNRGGSRQRMGQHQTFAFVEKVDGERVRSPWRMVELSLDSAEGGGQEAGSSDRLVLCKVYRSRNAKAKDESSMAAAEADSEGAATSAVVTPGRKEADEEIDAGTAAGPGRKRKAGDKDSETAEPSPGRRNKADGESADADTTGEIFAADSKDAFDAEEPGVPRDSRFYDFFGDSSAPLDAPGEAEQEPRDPRDPRSTISSQIHRTQRIGDW